MKMTALWMSKLSLFILLIPSLAATALLPYPTPRSPSASGKTCTVTPLGLKNDDVPQILKAFNECNNGGTVVFPEGNKYYIATRLNPHIYDVTIEWRGSWVVRFTARVFGLSEGYVLNRSFS